MKRLLSITLLLLLSASITLAQDICESDFTCDGDVDSADVSTFLEDFGRSEFFNPCPPCVPLSPVPKTGQTLCYDEIGTPRDCTGTGEDGEYQTGLERFTDNGDETVTDSFTKLMWLKDVDCMATHYPSFDIDGSVDTAVTWQHALDFVNGVNDGTYPLCGAGYSDWRLPNIKELRSIIGELAYSTLMPINHPFHHIQPYTYWSSTSAPTGPTIAFYVYAYLAIPGEAEWNYSDKNEHRFVWQVRGGH